MRTLILAPFDPCQLERIRDATPVEYRSWLDTRRLTGPDELAALIRERGVSILVVEGDFVFEETFEAAPGLRFVGVCRASTNQVDLEAATRRDVVVVNTPARNARAVAEHALGLIFSLARRIPAAHAYVMSGKWNNPVEPYISMRGVEIRGRTVGIVGLGAIGSELAAMCGALGVRVIAHDPYVANPPPGVRMRSLDAIVCDSDFVSLHVPPTSGAIGMIGDREISRMKSSAFLINCSDPSVVDREALIDALEGGGIAGAALDVFETHPIAPDNPLMKLNNLVLTPHIGGATAETIERHSKMMSDDILRFARGERPVNIVNPEVWN